MTLHITILTSYLSSHLQSPRRANTGQCVNSSLQSSRNIDISKKLVVVVARAEVVCIWPSPHNPQLLLHSSCMNWLLRTHWPRLAQFAQYSLSSLHRSSSTSLLVVVVEVEVVASLVVVEVVVVGRLVWTKFRGLKMYSSRVVNKVLSEVLIGRLVVVDVVVVDVVVVVVVEVVVLLWVVVVVVVVVNSISLADLQSLPSSCTFSVSGNCTK